jgi:hypothetical protein
MRPISCAAVLAISFLASSALSDNPFAPMPPVTKEAQIKKVMAKMEEIDKKIAELQKERELAEMEFRNLTMFTDIGIHFDVERAMMIPSPATLMR